MGAEHGHRRTGPPAWKQRITSHETFAHDSIDSLGYDWARISDPGIAPRFPRKVYLPRTTEDVVRAVRESRQLGEELVIRSKGHSSNDLVVSDGGAVLLTEKLDGILDIDETAMTATVQAGAVSALIDAELATRGLGLPIIGDHNEITVGGFASVGGISPASHRFGLFVDTVQRLEYVTWDGEVVTCSRTDDAGDFHRVLTGLGRYGVITTITVRIMRVDKHGTVLRNRQRHYRDVEAFIEASAAQLRDPGSAQFQRGVWVDVPAGGGLGLGQFSAYHAVPESPVARARESVAYNALHGLGYVSGRLPARLDRALKYVGLAGVMFSPAYASIKNIETFTDKVLDATVGDPSRMWIVLVPLSAYEPVFRGGYELMRDVRRDHGCFTTITAYVKNIRSPYLAQGRDDDAFCELTYVTGMSPEGMADDTVEELATRLDDLTIAHGAFRYMHTRTSRDPVRREQVDPNSHYARRAQPTQETAHAP